MLREGREREKRRKHFLSCCSSSLDEKKDEKSVRLQLWEGAFVSIIIISFQREIGASRSLFALRSLSRLLSSE